MEPFEQWVNIVSRYATWWSVRVKIEFSPIRIGSCVWLVGSTTVQTKTNSVAFSPQANYTDRTAPHVGEVNANFCR
jgi:hypothetical protein